MPERVARHTSTVSTSGKREMMLRMPEVDTVDVCLATLSGMMGAIKAMARGDLDA